MGSGGEVGTVSYKACREHRGIYSHHTHFVWCPHSGALLFLRYQAASQDFTSLRISFDFPGILCIHVTERNKYDNGLKLVLKRRSQQLLPI